MFGATAYGFTSLPIPQTDQIYGSRGNKNTCVAQGFFIQAGTTACFLGVSLAAYYLLTIKYGWSKVKMKNKRIVLFAPPVLVGLGFAFVGEKYYFSLLVLYF